MVLIYLGTCLRSPKTIQKEFVRSLEFLQGSLENRGKWFIITMILFFTSRLMWPGYFIVVKDKVYYKSLNPDDSKSWGTITRNLWAFLVLQNGIDIKKKNWITLQVPKHAWKLFSLISNVLSFHFCSGQPTLFLFFVNHHFRTCIRISIQFNQYVLKTNHISGTIQGAQIQKMMSA